MGAPPRPPGHSPLSHPPRREPPPTPWQRTPVTGELISCENCGQGVADYRGVCPFCGTPTGRPELPPPAARVEKRFRWRTLVVPIVLALVLAAVAGALVLAKSGGKNSTETLSPQASAFIDKAMPALDRVLAEARAGDDTEAAHDWDAIGDMPALTPADLTVDEKYTAYANAVRSYLMQDGDASLQQVEAAKAATQRAVAAVGGA
jgi:hypothetical protein